MNEPMRSALVREALAHQDPRAHGKRLADQHGLNFGVVWMWVLDEVRRRAEQQLPADGLMARLLDPGERARLLAIARADPTATLINRLGELLRTCPTTPAQIRALLSALPPGGELDGDFQDLLANPSTPEDLLFELLDQRRFISALGHRAGPRRLLESLAEEHDYDEAITTLALRHYASDDYPLADFLAFVRRHRACSMFDHNLRRARHLPADRHRAALAILDAGEAG